MNHYRYRLAILTGLTHYDINMSPALSEAVMPFLDGAQPACTIRPRVQ